MRAFIWLIAATVMALTAPQPAIAQAGVDAPATIPAVTPPPIIEPINTGGPNFSDVEIHGQYVVHAVQSNLAFDAWRRAYDRLRDYINTRQNTMSLPSEAEIMRSFVVDMVKKNQDLVYSSRALQNYLNEVNPRLSLYEDRELLSIYIEHSSSVVLIAGRATSELVLRYLSPHPSVRARP